MSRTFDPWIGSKYWSEGFRGLRVLILGEAHYGDAGTETPADTKEIVARWGQREPHRFFTGAQKLVAGIDAGAELSSEDRSSFWEAVAFYNYIQSFVGETSRIRPTSEQWYAGREPLLETLNELNPHLLVVLGKELSYNLPEIPTNIVTCVVQHPSSSVTYSKFKPTVQAAFEAAFAARN